MAVRNHIRGTKPGTDEKKDLNNKKKNKKNVFFRRTPQSGRESVESSHLKWASVPWRRIRARYVHVANNSVYCTDITNATHAIFRITHLKHDKDHTATVYHGRYVMTRGEHVAWQSYVDLGRVRVLSTNILMSTGTVYTYLSLDEEGLTDNRHYQHFISLSFTGKTLFDPVVGVTCETFWSLFPRSKVLAPKYDELTLLSIPSSAVSGAHHRHYRMSETVSLIAAANDRREYLEIAGSKMSMMTDATEAFVTGVIIWLLSLPDNLARGIALSSVFDTRSMLEWYSLVKEISSNFKHWQHVYPHDMAVLFEMEVLVNRDLLSVDWPLEALHRTSPTLAQVPLDFIYQAATGLFSDAARARLRPKVPMNWEQFWALRWQWSAAGSVHSQYQQDDQYTKSPSHLLKNKFFAINSMPDDLTLDDLLNRTAEIVAWPSVKYEWGKSRAIYGTDLTSYILYEFVMQRCEDDFPDYVPVGERAEPAHVKKLASSLVPQGYSFCLDFEDFNSQHSTEAMTTVLQAYFNIHRTSYSEDQLRTIPWLLTALMNQRVCANNFSDLQYTTAGTLFSGWRLTSFMNTALNICYVQSMLHNANIIPVGSLHNGDDVLVVVNSPIDAFKLTSAARALNIRVQERKCSLGAVAEFLRTDAKKATGTQYLTRGIATLVHGRTETKDHADIRAIVESTVTRLTEAQDRGMPRELADTLFDKYVTRMSYNPTIGRSDPDDYYFIARSHPILGGINKEHKPEGTQMRILYETRIYPDEHWRAGLPGVQAYTALLARYLQYQSNYAQLASNVEEASQRVVYSARRTVATYDNIDGGELSLKLALYGSHSYLKGKATYGKSRLIGIDLVDPKIAQSLYKLNYLIKDKDKFIEWMTILV